MCRLGYGGQMGGGALLVEEAQMHVKDKDLVATLSQQPGAPRLIAAVYARVNTPLGFTRWLGPPGNYLIARPAARAAAHRDSARTDMPLDAAVILGLGEERPARMGRGPDAQSGSRPSRQSRAGAD